jgi:dynein heavy chain
MSKLNGIADQLKGRDHRVTMGVLGMAKSRVHKRWKGLEAAIADACNEAKDNCRHLSTLDKCLEPLLGGGSPSAVAEALPGLMHALRTMYTASRFYNTTERLTGLFGRVSNKIISTSKLHIHGGDPSTSLWQLDAHQLTVRLRECIALCEAYRDQYRLAKDRLATQPKGKQFDFPEDAIFGKLERFGARLGQLVHLFTTVGQFRLLASHRVDGMAELISPFDAAVAELRCKPSELLDYDKSAFDEDLLGFDASIRDVERSLIRFINSSFETVSTTEASLLAMRQFQPVLDRPMLKDDLDSKLTGIFHNYGIDLETVRRLYEMQKAAPPTVRNAPPVTGAIAWARQLMRRIEEPMLKLQANRGLMSTKEAKKIVRTYNRIARTVVEFETLWHIAWTKSIEASKAGIAATLLIRHPTDKKLYVNFDREILQLIREAKLLTRIGVAVPEAARAVMLQEDKFKRYYNELSYSLDSYRAVAAQIPPVLLPLLEPHLRDFERKLHPGMVTLTWASMNIDGYLHRLHATLFRLGDLVSKVSELLQVGVERNLRAVSNMRLVNLPTDASFTLDRFVSVQEHFVQQQSAVLGARSREAERAVAGLMQLASEYTLEPGIAGPSAEIKEEVRAYFARLLYRAVLNCTKASLNLLKQRVKSRASAGCTERPVLIVNVELTIPHVSMTPSLDAIQAAINQCSRAVLTASRQLVVWNSPSGRSGGGTLFDDLGKDKDIVRTVLVLFGAAASIKRRVTEHMEQFNRYEWLWTESKDAAFSSFIAHDRSVEDYEAELQRYVAVEQDVARIEPVCSIGSIALDTAPLKYSLRAEAAAWKTRYTESLQVAAKRGLDLLVDWIDDVALRLKQDVRDLDSVRSAMGVLGEVREREGTIEQAFAPVEEMYGLLARHDHRVSREEADTVASLSSLWKKLRRQADAVADALTAQQTRLKSELVRSVKQFAADIAQFRNDWESNGPATPGVQAAQGRERLERYKALWEAMEARRVQFRAGEELFGLRKVEYHDLSRTKREIEQLEQMYWLHREVTTALGGFRELMWVDVPEAMDGIETALARFQGMCKRMPKAMRGFEAFTAVKKSVEEFVATMPLLQLLIHPCMRSRHWTMLMNATGKHLNVGDAYFRLSNILDANLLEKHDDVEEIAKAARSELQFEERFTLILEEWIDCALVFDQFQDRGCIVLGHQATRTMMERLDETQMSINSMLSSRHIGPFRDEVQSIYSKLAGASEIVEQWAQVQALWLHLVVVFNGDAIAKQMPQEVRRFSVIDRNWAQLMAKAREARHLLHFCCGNEHLRSTLTHMHEQLEVSGRALSNFLGHKRGTFPRFHFVSDAVLLDMLSQQSDPNHIQTHLASIFDSVDHVEFDDQMRIVAITSGDGQSVRLTDPVVSQGNLEEWLGGLEAEMRLTVCRAVHAAALDCETMQIEPLTHKYPAQIALLAMQMLWTLEVEDGLSKSSLSDSTRKAAARIKSLVAISARSHAEIQQHGRWTRKKVEVMITASVHHRDTCAALALERVGSAADFRWARQARSYWDLHLEAARVSIADAHFSYCNEYLGVKDRLCITPLANRCFISLSQALRMFLGGATSGPAATGKTETVKDMGYTLGKYVVTVNCSAQMDSRSMGAVLKGLAQSGCWACLDEFNRLDFDVLSVAAQQVGCILSALRESPQAVHFTDGTVTAVRKGCGIFITMDPSGPGRRELPGNLKSHFRGMMMPLPDREVISRVKLTAAGFEAAPELAKKVAGLYSLCERQFARQPQYDFGMRSILVALRVISPLKRECAPETPEPELVMRTLRDLNKSKLEAADVPFFLALLEDLFPALTASKPRNEVFEAALGGVLPELGLRHHEPWVAKVMQLFEMCLARHALVAIGPSGAGKSSMLAALLAALAKCEASDEQPAWFGHAQREVRLNPKAMSASQMFGHLDVFDGTWIDGAFNSIWRKANKSSRGFTWLVLDGPVDPEWVENLNSVMDEARVLTLANGDRIPMLRPNVTLHFEVEDLRNASPATVSRIGLVHVSSTDLGWMPMVEAWLATRKKQEAEPLLAYFRHLAVLMLEFVGKDVQPLTPLSHVAVITSMIVLLTAMLDEFGQVRSEIEMPVLERLFLFCSLWSIAGCLDSEDRLKMDQYLRKQTKNVPFAQAPDSIFEFRVDEASGEWVHWGSRIPFWEPPPGFSMAASFTSLLIPTIDSVRSEFFVNLNLGEKRALLLVGSPSTSKTSSLLQAMAAQDAGTTLTRRMCFAPSTKLLPFQRKVEAVVEKRMGKTYGPIHAKRMLIFIDDLSMPDRNAWGDQEALELMRQLMERGGLYSADSPGVWKTLLDLHFIGAMLKPGAGRNDLPNRVKRHFHVVSATQLSFATVGVIFGSMMKAHFNADAGAPPDVLSTAERLIDMTIQLREVLKAKLLPTPAKFHYCYSLRDLARVFQGIFMCPIAEVLESEAVLISLWAHECERAFGDRLIDSADKQLFTKVLSKMLEDRFGKTRADRVQKQPAFFVDFLRQAEADPDTGEVFEAERIYEPIPDFEALKDCVQDKMEAFNRAHGGYSANLILFNDALRHFMRISRVLRTPRGSALLVGVAGSGKRSLARLAAFTAGGAWVQPVMTKTYEVADLLNDLRPLYRAAGVSAKRSVLIISDKEIKNEAFLDYICAFLSMGEVPELISKDMAKAILKEVAVPHALEHPERETSPSSDELWDYFVRRARDNLRVVFCFSPAGDAFRQRCQTYTEFLNYCTVDWFHAWPEEALTAMAQFYMDEFPIQDEDADRILKQLMAHMGKVHVLMHAAAQEFSLTTGRQVYVTPRSFLTFIAMFTKMYDEKAAQMDAWGANVNTGLFKLDQAKVEVENMKGELIEKESNFGLTSAKCIQLLHDITHAQAKAEKKKGEVMVIGSKLGAEQMEIDKADRAIADDLAEANPALQKAAVALEAIMPKDIVMLKNMKRPPELIKRLFDAVLLLCVAPVEPPATEMGEPGLILEPSFIHAVPLMSRPSFLDELQGFDKERINDETIELLFPYTGLPISSGEAVMPLLAESLTYELARHASDNVAGLLIWINSMVLYATVAKKVKDRSGSLSDAKLRLGAARKKLDKSKAGLDIVLQDLDRMREGFERAMGEKQSLRFEVEATQAKVAAASRLLDGVGGEHARWKRASGELADELRRLSGNVVVACAFVCYAGPLSAQYRDLIIRERLLKDCAARNIPHTATFTIRSFLGDDAMIQDWTLQGLPIDDYSVQNGIVATESRNWPFLIDPQGQGQSWIKTRDASNHLRVTSFDDERFRELLEDAMAYGQPLLLEKVDCELDPIVTPVLEKNVQKSGRGFKIALADKECEYSDSFRMYLACNVANPHLPAELFAQVTVINFTVTTEGLEQRLLSQVLLHDRPDLETQHTELLRQQNNDMKQLKVLEVDLLQSLMDSTGSVLEEKSVVERLAMTKTASDDICKRQADASAASARMQIIRDEYHPVARLGTLLYFLTVDMAGINHMYAVSLQQFIEQFIVALERADKSQITSRRINYIIDNLRYHISCYVQRGLFQKHKDIWALMLALRIQTRENLISGPALSVLVHAGSLLDIHAEKPKPFTWIADQVWLNILQLARKVKVFSELVEAINRNDILWKHWFEDDAPEELRPPDFADQMTTFEMILLVRCIRRDRTMLCMSKYVMETLGKRFVEARPLDVRAVAKEAAPATPILTILSQGADITALILDLAKRLQREVCEVSLGRGQEAAADRLLKMGMAQGNWVLLHDCHLGIQFMHELEGCMARFGELSPNFKLWLASEPHDNFPMGLLHSCIKITNEAPSGMRAKLRGAYTWITQEVLSAVSHRAYKPLLFALVFMHSALQERRRFGPLGCSLPYEFTNSDLAASIQILQNHLTEAEVNRTPVDWDVIRYMVCEVQYGGHVTDPYDQRLICAYGKRWLTPRILEPRFEFFDGYAIPDAGELKLYLQHIDELPLKDSTEVFGVHATAELAIYEASTKAALNLVQSVGSSTLRSPTLATQNKLEVVLHEIEQLKEKLPSGFKSTDVKAAVKASSVEFGGPKPLNIFVQQETERLQVVIVKVQTTLDQLKLAIAGAVIMSPELAGVMEAIFASRVPSSWEAVSELRSPTLAVWFAHITQRVDFLANWLKTGRPPTFWLTGLFNPRGFLTANLQEICRKNAKSNWTLDDVVSKTQVLNQDPIDVRRGPDDGVYIYGLHLDGARWDKASMLMAEATPKTLFDSLPVLHVTGVLKARSGVDLTYTYVCPIYKNRERGERNYIFDAHLPTQDSPEKWTLRGVALVGDKD